jgi:outer membrane protein assembly factor BamB
MVPTRLRISGPLRMPAGILSSAVALVALGACGPITVSEGPAVWSRDLRGGPFIPVAKQSYINNSAWQQTGIAIGNDVLIAHGQLHLMDSATGRDRWVTSSEMDWSVSAYVVSGSKILALYEQASPRSNVTNFRFARIDPRSGAELWHIDVADNVDAVSLEADPAGFSYAAVDNHNSEAFLRMPGDSAVLHPYVVRASWGDGNAAWTRKLREPPGQNNPVHAIGVTATSTATLLVHTASLRDGGGLDAFAAHSGTQLWHADILSAAEVDHWVILPLDNGQALLTGPTNFGAAYQLRRIDTGAAVASGSLTELGVPEAGYWDFIVAGHVLYGWSESDRILSATDLNRKERLWKVKTDGSDNNRHVTRSLSLQSGTLYMGSNDGRIYAVNARDGRVFWRVAVRSALPERYPSPVVFQRRFVVDDGTVSAFDVPG